ncbi:hypothetical protein Y1Q_0018597 [Alligator mississippiensis]|uniref:Uncharacterized protein n=1 Tax=Alligator mississippiensis TaxID=8496 RepID=A0A151NRY0_ALLMI|nr:hypothetical protein Y1Q_0018597 [Alligator mississippiensis]
MTSVINSERSCSEVSWMTYFACLASISTGKQGCAAALKCSETCKQLFKGPGQINCLVKASKTNEEQN